MPDTLTEAQVQEMIDRARADIKKDIADAIAHIQMIGGPGISVESANGHFVINLKPS
jgi:hypothetical protein